MNGFLTAEWVAHLATTAAVHVRPGASVCIQHVVHDDGDTAVRYWLRVTDGIVTTGLGDIADADVTVTCDRATALALQNGDLSAQEAFRAGRLRLRGDVAALALLHNVMRAT